MAATPAYLPFLTRREDYFDHLEGDALSNVADLQDRQSRRPLVKTYMLETVAHGRPQPDITTLFPAHVGLERIDDELLRVVDRSDGDHVFGLLEVRDTRYPVLYTTLDVQHSDRWVKQIVDGSPWLDRLWLSSPILFSLWQYVQATTPTHRFVRLGFEHEARYESANVHLVEDLDDPGPDDDDRADVVSVERRRSRVQLTERLGVLQRKLPELMALYNPLESLVQLQMPSSGRGGHLLHFDGKATNRSDSFLEHRSVVGLVTSLYGGITERAEQQVWVNAEDDGMAGVVLRGAPVTVRFGAELDPFTFERLVQFGLQRKTSRFRIGGFMQRLGPTKVHLAAIDRHLWQPFLLEATSRQLVAVLPQGTCGNSIHRLITNVQRFVDPTAQVWLGSRRYQDVVASSLTSAA